MPATKKSTEPGTLVTVRITDGEGVEHTFHGNVVETVSLITQKWETSDTRYSHLPADERTIGKGYGEPSPWLRIYSATGNPIPGGAGVFYTGPRTYGDNGLAAQGADWFFSMYEFYVRIDSDDIDVRVATKAGKAWVESHLSLDNQRTRLVERIKALNPALADEAERLLGEVEHDAYERGKDDEYRANADNNSY
jgi:hypothetical protein